MLSIRISEELQTLLNHAVDIKKMTKSQIINEALINWLEENDKNITAWDAGKHLFGKYYSGESNNSMDYKKKLKESLGEKHSH